MIRRMTTMSRRKLGRFRALRAVEAVAMAGDRWPFRANREKGGPDARQAIEADVWFRNESESKEALAANELRMASPQRTRPALGPSLVVVDRRGGRGGGR